MIIDNYEIDKQERKEELQATFDEYGKHTKDTEEIAFDQILQIVECITTSCSFTEDTYTICKEELDELISYVATSIREEIENIIEHTLGKLEEAISNALGDVYLNEDEPIDDSYYIGDEYEEDCINCTYELTDAEVVFYDKCSALKVIGDGLYDYLYDLRVKTQSA